MRSHTLTGAGALLLVLTAGARGNAQAPPPATQASGPTRAAAPQTAAAAQVSYEFDFLIKGGRLIDPGNNVDGVRDIGIKDGKVAAVASSIDASRALKAVDASGLLVTPGLIDIHVHVFAGEKPRDYAGGDWSIFPDGYTLRSCTTSVADAGTSGWRNFETFKTRIIDTAKTRVFSFLNIVGAGMGSGGIEQNVADMEVKPTADMALKYKEIVVGIKSAHFNAAEWTPYERAEEVGRIAKIPVMVDFGSARVRTIYELFTKHFRPGDIYTHMYGGNRGEQDPGTKGPSAAMIEGRKRGVIFDVGHGGTSFRYSTAVPLLKAGFLPDSLSTDLHTGSMNNAMKDMLNVMGKFMAMGLSLNDVIRLSTVNPAKEIQRPQLGQLAVGAPADISVIRLEKGKFGYMDPRGGKIDGTERLSCELTVRDGKVVYDLNGLTAVPWEKLDPAARGGDPRWENIRAH
jgi:dihydroorotase